MDAAAKKKDAQLTIRLSAETKAALVVAACRRARSTNWLVVQILEAWLKHHPRRR